MKLDENNVWHAIKETKEVLSNMVIDAHTLNPKLVMKDGVNEAINTYKNNFIKEIYDEDCPSEHWLFGGADE